MFNSINNKDKTNSSVNCFIQLGLMPLRLTVPLPQLFCVCECIYCKLGNCKVHKRNNKGKCNVPLFNDLWIDLRSKEYFVQYKDICKNNCWHAFVAEAKSVILLEVFKSQTPNTPKHCSRTHKNLIHIGFQMNLHFKIKINILVF